MGQLGPELVLEHTHLYQLFIDPGFWRACPQWLDLKPAADKIRQQVTEELLRAGKKPTLAECAGCGNLRAILKPLQQAFLGRVGACAADSPELLALVTYLTLKRGYRPRAIVAYYEGADGKPQRLQF